MINESQRNRTVPKINACNISELTMEGFAIEPKTIFNLLGNVELAIITEILVSDESYTEQGLKNLWGGSKFSSVRNTDRAKAVEIVDLEGISLVVGRNFNDPKWATTVQLTLGTKNPASSFEIVRNVFGDAWSHDQAAYAERTDQRYRTFEKETHAMGNAAILYDLSTELVKKAISLEFHGDGTLLSLFAKTEGK